MTSTPPPGLAHPYLGGVLSFLDWATTGYGDKFRGAVVTLLVLILFYAVTSVLIETLFLTWHVIVTLARSTAQAVRGGRGGGGGGGVGRAKAKRK